MTSLQPGRIRGSNGEIILAEAVRPRGFLARARGLIGRAILRRDQAWWFEGCSAVHSFGMRHAIDVLHLDAHGRILHVRAEMPPFSWSRFNGSRHVVELAAGTAAVLELQAGDVLHFEPEATAATRSLPGFASPLLAVLIAACSVSPERPYSPDPVPLHWERTVVGQRLESAQRALREARLADAEIAYRQLAESHPRLPDVWLHLGNIYARQLELDAAVRVYREGLHYRPDDARLWHNLALAQTRQAVQTLEVAARVVQEGDRNYGRLVRFHDALLTAGAVPQHAGTTPTHIPGAAGSPTRAAAVPADLSSELPPEPSRGGGADRSPFPASSLPGDEPCWATQWGCE